MTKAERLQQISDMLDDPIGRKKLACLMVPAIKAHYFGGTTEEAALFMKKTNKEFAKHITWKDMEEHFGLNKSKCRRRYEKISVDFIQECAIVQIQKEMSSQLSQVRA